MDKQKQPIQWLEAASRLIPDIANDLIAFRKGDLLAKREAIRSATVKVEAFLVSHPEHQFARQLLGLETVTVTNLFHFWSKAVGQKDDKIAFEGYLSLCENTVIGNCQAQAALRSARLGDAATLDRLRTLITTTTLPTTLERSLNKNEST